MAGAEAFEVYNTFTRDMDGDTGVDPGTLKGRGSLGRAWLRAPGGGCEREMCPLPREARKLLDLHIYRVQGGSFLDSILMLTTKIKIINNTTI